jgi:hypothetical protein
MPGPLSVGPDAFQFHDGICIYRPCGAYSLVEAEGLVSRAIAYCRIQRIEKLLVDTLGLREVPIPTLLERFLMVEGWAQQAEGVLAVAMVAAPEYIHPDKFGVKVAKHFGLVLDIHTSEADALEWLRASGPVVD